MIPGHIQQRPHVQQNAKRLWLQQFLNTVRGTTIPSHYEDRITGITIEIRGVEEVIVEEEAGVDEEVEDKN